MFVGYQAIGTLGRALVDGISEVKLFGETIGVSAQIKKLPGLSGHADKQGLLDWISAFEKRPTQVFVVHGEDNICMEFANCLESEYAFRADAPYSGSVYDLVKGRYSHVAKPVLVERKTKTSGNSVFDRLLAAGQRLISVIKKNEGLANKELAKFADQINALADKWDR